jgi:gluconolactonase
VPDDETQVTKFWIIGHAAPNSAAVQLGLRTSFRWRAQPLRASVSFGGRPAPSLPTASWTTGLDRTRRSALELLASGYRLVEGPRVDADGGLYFSDVHGGGVYRRSRDGALETVVPKRRGVGGIALHADGGIVCSGRNICHVRNGETRIVFELPNTPGWNDIFTDSQGRIYAGTMRTSPFGDASEPRTPGELWRIDAEGKAIELYGDVSLTNGIGFSPDGTTLYHSDTVRGHVIAHDVAADGSCTRRREFARLERGGPDGLAVDAEGYVWVAAYGGSCVSRFAPDGKLERHVEVPAREVTSVCFGGDDPSDLYIATADNTDTPSLRGCVFRTRAPSPGLTVPLARI